MTAWWRAIVVVTVLGGCSTAATAPREAPRDTSLEPTEAAPPVEPAAPAPVVRRFSVGTTPIAHDIDAELPAAPCDFSRSYRGTIGKTSVTVLLRRTGHDAVLSGLSHYDKPGPAIAITGTAKSDATFAFTEQPGGSFSGSCDTAGVLKGTFTLGTRKEPFELRPRPSGWPGLYRVTRNTTALPNHPICKKLGLPDQMTEVSTDPVEDFPRAICLPTDPKKRRAVIAESPDLGCHAADAGYRVFGLASPEVEQRTNAILASTGYDSAAEEIQSECTGLRSSDSAMSLLAASSQVLVVSGFHSEYMGGAHPLNGSSGVTVIDLVQGRSVALAEIVDPVRLRYLASECLPLYTAAMAAENEVTIADAPPVACGAETTSERYLWGCGADDRAEPSWGLLPEGVVIGSWGHPHVSAALEGQGPVLPWSVLARESVLRLGSPVAHLWAGVQPAGADALACSSAYELDHLRTWTEAP